MEMQRDGFAFIGEGAIAFRDTGVAMNVASRRISLPCDATTHEHHGAGTG